MATPHIQASLGDFAKSVLMPGDPLRAKFIADTFLTNVKQVNNVRNMYGFTGLYLGKPISVMASGMGMPSMGIYSHELYTSFGVETIIRVGTTGAYVKSAKLYDMLNKPSYSISSLPKGQAPIAIGQVNFSLETELFLLWELSHWLNKRWHNAEKKSYLFMLVMF